MFRPIKGSFYALFFILLNLVYLIIELSFNARVLDVSATLDQSTDLGQLEVYGRTISSIGATLLAWRLLVPYHQQLNLLHLVIKFFVIGVIVFPLVFIGQKKLVDTLVDQSSADTRRSAEILTLLKYGIANGFVEIDELAMDELTLQTAEGKMFISVSGLLVYNSENMRQILERELRKIAGYAIATQQSRDRDQLYKNYLYVREKVLDHYQQYRELVAEMEAQQASTHTRAIGLYEDAMNHALIKWLGYQSKLQNDEGIAEVNAQHVNAIQYLLLVGQERVNGCGSNACIEEAMQLTQMRLSQNLGFYSPVKDWCDFEQNPSGSLHLVCLKHRQQIEESIIRARKTTLAVSAGLSQAYDNKLDYLQSMELRSTVFEYLEKQGIQTHAHWQFEQHLDLLNDIQFQLEQSALQVYRQQVKQRFDIVIPPRTTVADFIRIPMMQNYFAQALGDHYVEPVDLTLGKKDFDQRYLKPIYFARFNALLNKLQADEQWYEADAPYEHSGKNSLRNLIIPPVAIAFSLVFGLLNMINLLLNFIFLVIEERLWLRWLGSGVMIVMVIMLPTRHEYQIYSQSAYQQLLTETQSNYGYWAGMLDWIAKTEPLVYPVGDVLRYHLMNDFNFD